MKFALGIQQMRGQPQTYCSAIGKGPRKQTLTLEKVVVAKKNEQKTHTTLAPKLQGRSKIVTSSTFQARTSNMLNSTYSSTFYLHPLCFHLCARVYDADTMGRLRQFGALQVAVRSPLPPFASAATPVTSRSSCILFVSEWRWHLLRAQAHIRCDENIKEWAA